jgi:DNA-binding transcriptional LysR family regulator
VRLGQLAFIAVATPEFLAPDPGPVAIDTLLSSPILTLNRRHVSREVFDAACRLAGMRPRIVLESTSPHTLFSMAGGGNGIAVVPSSARLDNDALVMRPIALRGEIIHFDFCAMFDSRAPLPAYGHRFVADLQAHIDAEEAAEKSPESNSENPPEMTPHGHLHIA